MRGILHIMHPILNIAVSAARKAGNIILQAVDQLDTVKVEQKGLNDYVTQIDKSCEQEIIYIIRKAYPNHTILGEESGLSEMPGASKDEITWVIDPLDGTNNFIHGFPQFCVSIGVMHNNRVEHGVIFDPLRDELFTASRGNGAQLNNRKIRVSKATSIGGALIGTSYRDQDAAHLFDFLKNLSQNSSGARHAGSAALDLAYVAAGRLDGVFAYGLKMWDMAAGSLMIREAGGLITDFKGQESFIESGNILAGNPKIYQALLMLMEKHRPEGS
jgi:myo-inositol-1(or 4)-monophosphatase